MKIIRKIAVFLLSFILYALIGMLFISFAIKDIVQNKMVGGVIKGSFVPTIVDSAEISNEEKAQLQEILDDEEFNSVINEMVGEIISSMGEGEVTIDQQNIDQIFDYIIENKEELEKITKTPIDVSEIEELKNSDEIQSMGEELSQVLNDSTKELGQSEKQALKTYTYMVSDSFRTTIIILIIIDILLIALVQWSLYAWLKILGRAAIASGITIIALFFISTLIINEIMKMTKFTININNNSLLVMGTCLLISGIVLCLIKNILDKIFKKQKEEKQQVPDNFDIPKENDTSLEQ